MSDQTIEDVTLRRLDEDDKYQKILQSVGDEKISKQIDLTVRTFVIEIAKGLENVRRSMGDDAVRAKMQELIQRASRGK